MRMNGHEGPAMLPRIRQSTQPALHTLSLVVGRLWPIRIVVVQG